MKRSESITIEEWDKMCEEGEKTRAEKERKLMEIRQAIKEKISENG